MQTCSKRWDKKSHCVRNSTQGMRSTDSCWKLCNTVKFEDRKKKHDNHSKISLAIFLVILKRNTTVTLGWSCEFIQAMGCKMSQIYFLDSYLEFFPDNLGRSIHQQISKMENRYQEKWSPSMLDDYRWISQLQNMIENHHLPLSR